AEPVELGEVSAGLDDIDLGVCADIFEAELVNLAQQGSTLRESHVWEGRLGRVRGGGPHRVGVAHPHAKVRFLEHQPAAGNQPGDHPLEQVQAGGYMHKHRSGVYEIERAGRERVGTDVVSKNLDIRGV